MQKHYIFYKEDVINLLLSHTLFLFKKYKEFSSSGDDFMHVTQEECRRWAEECFNKMLARGEVKVETLLDEVDDLMKKVYGMTARERAVYMKKQEGEQIT